MGRSKRQIASKAIKSKEGDKSLEDDQTEDVDESQKEASNEVQADGVVKMGRISKRQKVSKANKSEEGEESSEDDETDGVDESQKEALNEDSDENDNGDQEEEKEEKRPAFISDGRYRNKQRSLVLCSRGVTARYRHLLEDLRSLMPHHKRESKLDPGSGGAGQAVNDIMQLRSCTSVLFLECRKKQDCYMWLGLAGGPSARFHISNIHTMDELRLTGNCMKGSRPVLTFDQSFSRFGHLKLLKEIFIDIYGTPRGHPKSKPFVDRIMAFYYADKKIWVRNYQIIEQKAENAKIAAQLSKEQMGREDATSLVEIGPRFVMNPIRIFRGSFGGQTLYKNSDYIPPNELRAEKKNYKGNVYMKRKIAQTDRKEHLASFVIPHDPLDSVFR